MKAWTQWEIVRHQVAACGQVLDANDRPIADAQVTIIAMPKAFALRVKDAAKAAGPAWEEMNERCDRAVLQADGIYYFLDLPAGRYTIKGVDNRSGAQDEKRISVAWGRDGKVKMAVGDLKLAET